MAALLTNNILEGEAILEITGADSIDA